jgi:micrococcal nuclease
MYRRAAIVLVALLALAGCLSLSPTDLATPADPGDAAPADSERLNATVTRVVDGDTVEVRYADGTTDTVRLVGVDTPETRGGTTPDEFEGVPDSEAGRTCLLEEADNATRALEALVADEPVALAVDPDTDRRGSYARLLAYVVVDGVNVNERLVERGHARVYDSEFSLADRFYELEDSAQDAHRGVWQCRDPGVASAGTGLSVRVVADAPGDDRENPNGEYVVLANRAADPLSVGNWTVSDAADHTYTFLPDVTIPAGGSIRLYSGSGTDSATEFYRSEGPIWNNGGDTVSVRAENGTVVARESY